MPRFDLFDPMVDAKAVADEFNARHGGAFLTVNKHAARAVVLSASAIEHLKSSLCGWYTARALFEHVHARKATHGELVNLGRQLGKLFPTDKTGPHSFYFVAPADVPVRSRM
jgi:hypothetical protein